MYIFQIKKYLLFLNINLKTIYRIFLYLKLKFFKYFFQITVTEMILNKHFVVTLPPTNETVMRHKFNSIKHGGKYKIIISTDVEDAIPSQSVIYTAPDIQPPHQVNVLHKDQGFIIFWQEHDLPSTLSNVKYHYEILVVEGSNTMKESSAKIYKVDQPPYIYKDAKPDVIYTFAIRLVTEEGFQSPLSEVFSTRYSAGNYENYFFNYS